MAKTYSAYTVNFLEKSTDQGLGYTFSRLFSVIPSNIGHLLDTLLGLDGLFFEKDSHFSGPCGFLLGFIPLIVGFILGKILQVILNAPSYLAYYLLDVPLSWLFRGEYRFNKIMVEFPLLNLISSLLIKFTEATPTQMQGLFGFALGLFPHIARHLVNRIGAIFTSIIDFAIDNICDGIRFMYAIVAEDLLGEEKLLEKPQKQQQQEEPEQPPQPQAKTRLRRPVEKKEIDEVTEATLLKVCEQKIDLFAVLGTSLGAYEQDAKIVTTQFRKLGVSCHPDKVTDEQLKRQAEKQWLLICWAKEILLDPNSAIAKKYLYRYKNEGFAQSPASPILATATTTSNSAAAPADDWRSPSTTVLLGENRNGFLNQPPGNPAAPTGRRIKRPAATVGTMPRLSSK